MSDTIKLHVHEVDTPLIVTRDIVVDIDIYTKTRKDCENYDPHIPSVHMDVKDINGVYYLCDQIFFPGGQSFKVGDTFNFGGSEKRVPKIDFQEEDDRKIPFAEGVHNSPEPEFRNDRTGLVRQLYKALDCKETVTHEFISQVLDDIMLFDKKQQDYGSKNISEFEDYGVLIRCNDKIARLKNLYSLPKGQRATNESIEDNWTDLSIYGIIARLVRKGVWPR